MGEKKFVFIGEGGRGTTDRVGARYIRTEGGGGVFY